MNFGKNSGNIFRRFLNISGKKTEKRLSSNFSGDFGNKKKVKKEVNMFSVLLLYTFKI
jgi:hypothetical protein